MNKGNAAKLDLAMMLEDLKRLVSAKEIINRNKLGVRSQEIKNSKLDYNVNYNHQFHDFLQKYGYLFVDEKVQGLLLNSLKKQSDQSGNSKKYTENVLSIAKSILNDIKKEYPDYEIFINEKSKDKVNTENISTQNATVSKANMPNEIYDDFVKLLVAKKALQKKNATESHKNSYDEQLEFFMNKHGEFLRKNGFSPIVGKFLDAVPRTSLGINRFLPVAKEIIRAVKMDCADFKSIDEKVSMEFDKLIKIHRYAMIEKSVEPNYRKALVDFSAKYGDYISKHDFEEISKKLLENLPKRGQEWLSKDRDAAIHSIENVKNDYEQLRQKDVGLGH